MSWLDKLKDLKRIGVVEASVDNAKTKKGKLSIRGFIGSGMFQDGVTDKDIENALKEIGSVDELTVSINSGGGSVFDAFSIFSQLRKFPARITTEIEGVAASAAAFLSQAGDVRNISENAMFMIHEASGVAMGNKKRVGKFLNLLKKIDGILEKTFVKSSTTNLNEIRDLMDKEEFLTAEEAKERGFVDAITDESDVEPHITPKKKAEDTLASIYERDLNELDDNEKKFEQILNEFDDWSTEPYDLNGNVDLSNINVLRYLNARSPKDSYKERIDKFYAEHPDYNKKIEVKFNNQIYPLTENEVAMLSQIVNALNVQDETEVLAAIETLKKEAEDSGQLNIAATAAPLDDKVKNQLTALQSEVSEIKNQNTELVNQNAQLVAENESLRKVRDDALERVNEVIEFKNKQTLEDRRKEIDRLFYNEKKITPDQYRKAIEDFVDIDPGQVKETNALFEASLEIWGLNHRMDTLEVFKGVDGQSVIAQASGSQSEAERLGQEIQDKVEAYQKEHECSYDKAYRAVENSEPELFAKYESLLNKE